MRLYRRFLPTLLALFLIFSLALPVKALSLSGSGTQSDPYLIENAADLQLFRDMVNSGTDFDGKLVRQCSDIDLKNEPWTPIGLFDSEKYFRGIYDGAGHTIENLFIPADAGTPESAGNNGLFGVLLGSVANLGIESGLIEGNCSGSITSHGYNAGAEHISVIINSYSKATVNAVYRAGGIADSFDGLIVGCWSDCDLSAETTGGIVSHHAAQLINCISAGSISPEDTAARGCLSDLPGDETLSELLNEKLYSSAASTILSPDILYSWTFQNGQTVFGKSYSPSTPSLTGDGTKESPYLIQTAADLKHFRDMVNNGTTFTNEYVLQTADIDLQNEPWTPIGLFGSDRFFVGVYDGGGHVLENLFVPAPGNNGLFGQLYGVILNLGIESGLIMGDCCGSLSSHGRTGPIVDGVSWTSVIVNCYNKADVIAQYRAGGIADNFQGNIINSWSDCDLSGLFTGGITSYNPTVIHCVSTQPLICSDYKAITVDSKEADVEWLSSPESTQWFNENLSEVAKKYDIGQINESSLASWSSLGVYSGFSDLYNSGNVTASNSNRQEYAAVLIVCIFSVLCLFLAIGFRLGWKQMWFDSRSYKFRILRVFLPTFLLCFMYCVFSPLEFFFNNTTYLNLILPDFIPFLLLFGFGLPLILSASFACLKGKCFDWLCCLLLGIALASYIQIMCMNNTLGLLDGNTVFSSNIVWTYFNLGLWLIILALPFFVRYFFKKHWDKILPAACVFLVAVQLTALVSYFITAPSTSYKAEEHSYVLDASDQFTVSDSQNVIVLLLDTFSNTYVDEMLGQYPDALDCMKDFTYFDNADCVYEGSCFATPYLLTGQALDTTIPIDAWYDVIWAASDVKEYYDRLSEKGYSLSFFMGATGSGTIYLSDEASEQEASQYISNLNLTEMTRHIDDLKLSCAFLRSSAYRYFPICFKEALRFSAAEFSDICTIENPDGTVAALEKNVDVYAELQTQGITEKSGDSRFIVQHLEGMHPPRITDERCEQAASASVAQAAKGCMVMVESYLSELKRLGVYDASTIIIMADHGQHGVYQEAQPAVFIKRAHETNAVVKTSHAPISFMDFRATILQCVGDENYEDFGRSFFEIEETELRERSFYLRVTDPNFPKVPKYNSSQYSGINVLYKYTYTGDLDDLCAEGNADRKSVIPLTSFLY